MEDTENDNKFYPQISQMKYLATNKHEVTQIKPACPIGRYEMSFSLVFICLN